jgi:hypothetical protein
MLVTALFFAISVRQNSRYFGHRVLEVITQDDQIESLASWLRETSLELDIWRWPTSNDHASFSIGPNDYGVATRELLQQGLTWDVTIPDLQKTIDEESTIADRARRKLGNISPGRRLATSEEDLEFVSAYHTFPEIQAWCEQLVARYSCMATTEEIGTSTEGRSIFGIRITAPAPGSIFSGGGCSSSQSQVAGNRTTVWLDAGTHSREWIAVGATLAVIHSMLNGYEDNEILKMVSEEVDFFVVPVTNPDGWQYTMPTANGGGGARMWRKTRMDIGGGNCRGVDMNRNFDHHWGEVDASRNKCAENYAGASAADQPETRAVQDYIQTHAAAIGMFVTFHNWGQMWMSPWAWTYAKSADHEEQTAVARRATAALKRQFGTVYTTGAVAHVIYRIGGCASDWAYAVAGIKFAYSVELRGPDVSVASGGYGFMVPANQIVPTSEETLRAVEQLALHLWEGRTGRTFDYDSSARGAHSGGHALVALGLSMTATLLLLVPR